MILRPYKFQVVPVCQKLEDGKVVGEQIIAAGDQPVTVFGVDGLREFAEGFEAKLAELPAG